MSEQPSVIENPEKWQPVIGPVVPFEEAVQQAGIDEFDLIALNTKDKLRVCPEKQFLQFVDDSGQTKWETSKYVGLGWKISCLSGLGEWSCAGGFFAPRKGEDKSHCDGLLNTEANQEEKMHILSDILQGEFERSMWSSAPDKFVADLLKLGEEYGIELTNLLPSRGAKG